MPASLNGNLFEFNKAIIDATAQYAIAFKPNMAFYEVQGASGITAFEDTVAYIRAHYPDIFIIADAKRGDIGNTSKMYARSFFETMGVDALTVAPYMGEDSITPFLGYKGKWVVVLALTSNKGSLDFQHVEDAHGTPLYMTVLKKTKQWGSADDMMCAGLLKPLCWPTYAGLCHSISCWCLAWGLKAAASRRWPSMA